MSLDIFTQTLQPGQNCTLVSKAEAGGITLYRFRLTWTEANAAENHEFILHWEIPRVGIQYQWHPSCGTYRGIQPNWAARRHSMFASNAPVTACYDGAGTNRYTWALSECQKLVQLRSGVVEESGMISLGFTLGTRQFTNQYETELTLRIDQRPIPLYDALADTAAWWAETLIPAAVPADAKKPCYSFWYSYHQELTDAAVEEECRRAKALGFEVCIIDDGWQTEDAARDYGFCGDWTPAPNKFPDMAAHVARVHAIGMKYILWFSVPFVGYSSRCYEQFKDKMLYRIDWLRTGVLDPRYKEVRDFIIGIYRKALVDWDLDGFKLDFIDNWQDKPDNAPYNENMDIPALQDAVQLLMNTIIRELKEVKPDIMLEFRQSYTGPHMRTFGNMFRVGDCPGDYVNNRVGIFDLRMVMGNTAVHSDMLMWHQDESPELDAIQIVSIMFGVMQYSARLDSLNPRTAKMSRFWLDFLADHRDVLLDGKLRCYDAHLLYTWAQSSREDTCIAAVYAPDKCIAPEQKATLYIANGANSPRVLAELEAGYQAKLLNCCGEAVGEQTTTQGINVLNIPAGGMAVLTR